MIKNKINVMHIHQVYSRMNHVGVCMSYTATLNLLDEVSKLHTTPLQQWIADDVLFKFWVTMLTRRRVSEMFDQTTMGPCSTCTAS